MVMSCPIHGEGPCGQGGVGGTVCCDSHHAVETVSRLTYRVCFECGHVWTRLALMRRYLEQAREIAPDVLFIRRWWRSRWWRISFCQECIHDW